MPDVIGAQLTALWCLQLSVPTLPVADSKAGAGCDVRLPPLPVAVKQRWEHLRARQPLAASRPWELAVGQGREWYA